MKILELRLNHPEQKAIIPIRKISEVIETVEYDLVDYNGLHNTKRLTYTVRLDSGTEHLIDGAEKIFEISYRRENPNEINNAGTIKIEKEIALEDFYEWYLSQIAEEN